MFRHQRVAMDTIIVSNNKTVVASSNFLTIPLSLPVIQHHRLFFCNYPGLIYIVQRSSNAEHAANPFVFRHKLKHLNEIESL
jgi:hypothetical protein